MTLPVVLILAGCQSTPIPQPTGDPFPKSIKGYELYIWDEGDRNWFTLTTGTNRAKTPAEVYSSERDPTDSDGWIVVTVAGIDAIGGQLARLPKGESITVMSVRYPADEQLEMRETSRKIARTLHLYADSLGLCMQP